MKFAVGRTHVEVNVPSRAALFQEIRARLGRSDGFSLATLNLDHLTKLRRDPVFADAYAAQDLVTADGRPVVWLSHIAGRPVSLVPGSDLVVPLSRLAAEMGVPVALIGSTPQALSGAKTALEGDIDGLEITFTQSPPQDFDPTGDTAAAICDELNANGAQLCFIALGAPKQEVFTAFARDRCPNVGFAGVGAGIDFLSGHQIRAPALMRAIAMEWLWRAMNDPRRLVPRYARCFAILPLLTVQAFLSR